MKQRTYLEATVAAALCGEAAHPSPAAMAAEDLSLASVMVGVAAAGGSGAQAAALADRLGEHRAGFVLGAGNERLRVAVWLSVLGERALAGGLPDRAQAFGDLAAELIRSMDGE